MFVSPSPLNLTSEESTPPQFAPPATSGLKQILFDKRIGVIFNNYLPTILAEASLMFVQLSTQLKCAINYDLISGVTYTLGGQWSSEKSEVSSTLILSMSGILWQFESVSMLCLVGINNSSGLFQFILSRTANNIANRAFYRIFTDFSFCNHYHPFDRCCVWLSFCCRSSPPKSTQYVSEENVKVLSYSITNSTDIFDKFSKKTPMLEEKEMRFNPC